jgi:hypothetical protein
MAQQTLEGQGLLRVQASRLHSDTPHSVGLLWTSDRPEEQTSTWRNTTLTGDRHPSPGGIRTHNSNKRETTNPHLRPSGRCDQKTFPIKRIKYKPFITSNKPQIPYLRLILKWKRATAFFNNNSLITQSFNKLHNFMEPKGNQNVLFHPEPPPCTPLTDVSA